MRHFSDWERPRQRIGRHDRGRSALANRPAALTEYNKQAPLHAHWGLSKEWEKT